MSSCDTCAALGHMCVVCAKEGPEATHRDALADLKDLLLWLRANDYAPGQVQVGDIALTVADISPAAAPPERKPGGDEHSSSAVDEFAKRMNL